MAYAKSRLIARTHHPRGYSANLLTGGSVKPQAGWREVGTRRIYFRSRWEANYARYLEHLRILGHIISWEHESTTFWFEGIKRGCVSYLPDFKIKNSDGSYEYHEVKGWLDPKSKTKLKRMAKYHPHVKVHLIGKKEYNNIRKKIGAFIFGWE